MLPKSRHFTIKYRSLGTRSWIKLIVPALLPLDGSFAHAEGPGRDYAPFLTIDGYERHGFVEHRFDKAVFLNEKGTPTTVAGHFFEIHYSLQDPTVGGVPYLLNSLQDQLKTIHAEVLDQIDRCYGVGQDDLTHALLTVRFRKDNIPVWVAISCSAAGDGYSVYVVEEQGFHR
jgi:hypothetical protein